MAEHAFLLCCLQSETAAPCPHSTSDCLRFSFVRIDPHFSCMGWSGYGAWNAKESAVVKMSK